MLDQYYNPFQGMDVKIPATLHAQFETYCQKGTGNPELVDNQPFPRMVDLWFLSLCVAARLNLEPIDTEDFDKKDAVKIIEGVVFMSDPWRVNALMLLAISQTGDPQIVSQPKEILNLANGLALAGLPKVIEMLQAGSAEPIWNLTEAIENLLS